MKKRTLKRLVAGVFSLIYLHVNVVYAGIPSLPIPSVLFNSFTPAKKTPRVLTFHYDPREARIPQPWEIQPPRQQEQGQRIEDAVHEQEPVHDPITVRPTTNEIQ